ncbi:MAG: MFS transporter [Bacteroidetes bacterium]|nr:MFS transporter [Bacteroidota bacterium]
MSAKSSPYLSKIIIVAALGYFVDIYDLVLFGMERVSSLTDILSKTISDEAELKRQVKEVGISLLNWQMFGMLVGGVFWGILGDKKGRLSVLFGSIFLYSIANIANAMVQDTTTYALLRFISGFGLAGELGAGITLVSESMDKDKRGWGATIVASVGLFGAVVAGTVGISIGDWRVSYIIGGVMGLALLVMRIGVLESTMFKSVKESNVEKGNFLSLFKTSERFIKFITIILVALPVWYVMGILITFCPELMKSLGMENPPENARLAMTLAYVGITIGDIVSGVVSQKLQSRKKSLVLFLLLAVLFVVGYFTIAKNSVVMFYTVVILIGFATGYWAVFISTASELFGTNLRATVTTSVPNFVRGGTILITTLFQYFSKIESIGNIYSAIIVGLIVFALGFWAWYRLEETFHKDLNYTE